MPKIEIGTQLHYELSPLESMLEKSLNANNLNLVPLIFKEAIDKKEREQYPHMEMFYGIEFDRDELCGGRLYRKFIFKETKDEIIYRKGEERIDFASNYRGRAFPNIPKIIKLFDEDPHIIGECISFRRKCDFAEVWIERHMYSNSKRDDNMGFWIMPWYEDGKKLFTDAFNLYFGLAVSPEEFKCNEDDLVKSNIDKSNINSIIKKNAPTIGAKRLRKVIDKEYVKMMVNYFCLKQSLPPR